MREFSCDVLIVGGGTGGVAAAMAASSLGCSVILTEETDWVGGQLTAQAVPPDEHPWIERFGATARYREYRQRVRLKHSPDERYLNPGCGWVSQLCHRPAVSVEVLTEMLTSELIEVRLRTALKGSFLLSQPPVEGAFETSVHADRVESVVLIDLESGEETLVHALIFIDATETGELLAATGTEFVTGAESRADTGEPHAVDGPAQPENQQAITWVFAMGHDAGSHRVIDRPDSYEFWQSFRPPFWPVPFFSFDDVDPVTLAHRQLPLFSEGWRCWFKYRQIVAEPPVTIVNWPQNDYFLTPADSWERLQAAKELSRCWLYWMQTEGGYPGLTLDPSAIGTSDGFAKTPYIRESRRIRARFTVREQHVASAMHPGLDRAPELPKSVGVGAYRIDLHPSTGGDNYIDVGSLPFQIPLGSLIPVRVRNLLPACKNLGVTHITNGCYRLHPVEWNIGESAGLLAAFCVTRGLEPSQVYETDALFADFESLLHRQGIETAWPRLRAL